MSEDHGQDPPPLGSEHTSKVPNAKRPKPRPPQGFRDKSFVPGKSLPTYTGPYSVGTFEIECAAREPRKFSHISRKGQPALKLETVLMTVYYPAALETHDPLRRNHHMSRELWLGRPRLGMVAGYSRFISIPPALTWPFFVPVLFTKLPAYRNAGIARHWAPAVDTKSGGVHIKTEHGEEPGGLGTEEPTFPLIVFSHGLGGTRTMYSSICGEFASYGFVVCSVEHRDGSGPRTYINHTNAEDERGEQRKQDAHVDYLFPKDNPFDTSPINDKGVDVELRGAQIDLRMAEIEEAYEILRLINNGDGQKVAEKNFRREGFVGSSSHGLDGIEWDAWKGRISLHHVTACGHSFGAATVVEMLRHEDRFHYFSQGIIYDIWGAGTRPPEEKAPEHRLRAPLLAINSEAFTYWKSNFELVESLVDEAQSNPDPSPSWMMTVRGTIHISQSDFTLLYPHVCSLFLKAVANPQRAIDLNINASLEFLHRVLPADMAQASRSARNEELLNKDVSPLHEIPTSELHRPKDKWVGARIRIPHEYLYRISPKLFRKVKRYKAERNGEQDETGAEIWLHSKPSAEIISKHLYRTSSDSRTKQ